jgi:uncharacterized protein YkwD
MRIEALKPLSRNLLPLLTLALLAIPVAAFGQASSAFNMPAPCRAEQAFSRAAETLIAERINAERARLMPFAPGLRRDEQLSRIAELRSCELASAGKPLSHLDTNGHFEAADIVFSVFGLYGSVAENLMQMDASASGQSFGAEEFAKAAVDGWMNSPEHRPQILDPGYNLSGIGVARIGGQAVATQVFHGPPHRQPRTGNSMRRAANARPE